MDKATIFTPPLYLKNKQFDFNDPILSRNKDLYPAYLLKKRLADIGFDLSTQDINPPADSSFVIFNEMPPGPVATKGKRYLLLIECSLIRPDNWDLTRHRGYDKIFTWNDALVDDKKYFKLNIPCNLERVSFAESDKREKLCALIAGNKYARRNPIELYSRRIEAIRWFEKHHPDDFDLYGIGWDSPLTTRKVAKAFLYGRPSYVFDRKFPSYRGPVGRKLEILRKYKFSICYENARDIPGYITEKIIDCFTAGCVPVYWGAPNIGDHVPTSAFVDFKNFKSYEELYRYLTGMPDREYRGYLESIEGFLNGAQARRFGIEAYVDQIAGRILDDFTPRGAPK
jgi:hypothetical protein